MSSNANWAGGEFRQYISVLWRRWPWVLLPLLLFPLMAVYLTASQSATYEATARVLLDESAAQEVVSGTGARNARVRDRFVANELSFADGDAVREAVRQQLGLGPDDDLPEGTIDSGRDSDVLTFSFFGSTPEAAALHTNTWAGAYIEQKKLEAESNLDTVLSQLEDRLEKASQDRSEIRANLTRLEDRIARTTDVEQRQLLLTRAERELEAIGPELELLDARIADLVADIATLRLNLQIASVGVAQLVEAAVEPDIPSSGRLSINLVLALVLGTLTGVGLAMLIENLTRSVNTPDDVASMELAALGSVPRAKRRLSRDGLATISRDDPQSPVASSFQKLRTVLQFSIAEKNIKTILVTSPDVGAGKTTVAANLAISFAKASTRVVLLDADLDGGDVHKVFGVSEIPGVSEALINRVSVGDVVVAAPQLVGTMVLMPAGTAPPNSAALMASPMLGRLLKEVEPEADLIVLDSPAALPTADAFVIAPLVDGVVVVVESGRTRIEALEATIEGITRSGGTVLGVLVNRVSERSVFQQVRSNPALAPRTVRLESLTPAATSTDDEGAEAEVAGNVAT